MRGAYATDLSVKIRAACDVLGKSFSFRSFSFHSFSFRSFSFHIDRRISS